MAKLKEALQELFPSEDLTRSARSKTGARLISGQRTPPEMETNYLPLMAVLLGGLILGIAILKPQNGGVGGLLGVGRNPQPGNDPNSQPENWQQQEQNFETPSEAW